MADDANTATREVHGGHAELELWGGVEATINRVGDEYFDQLELNGHRERLGDLDRFAELGLGWRSGRR